MNRRQLLSTVGAAVLLGPAWLRTAFAAKLTCPTDGERLAWVTAAWKQGQAVGKPLLAFVVSNDGMVNYHRAHGFGEWLNHGGDAALALLAQVEVVCATEAHLGQVLGTSLKGDPTMWFVEVVGGAPVSTPLILDKKVGEAALMRGEDDVKADHAIDARIAAHTALLQRALTSGGQGPTRRAALALAALSESDRADVQAHLDAPPSLSDTLVDKAAAAFVARATASSKAAVTQRLAKVAHARLVTQPVAGSLWANATGCGEPEIEGVENEPDMVDCGMGFVPARSVRFVRFYACTPG